MLELQVLFGSLLLCRWFRSTRELELQVMLDNLVISWCCRRKRELLLLDTVVQAVQEYERAIITSAA